MRTSSCIVNMWQAAFRPDEIFVQFSIVGHMTISDVIIRQFFQRACLADG